MSGGGGGGGGGVDVVLVVVEEVVVVVGLVHLVVALDEVLQDALLFEASGARDRARCVQQLHGCGGGGGGSGATCG